jgi:pimeloyl-ACP methyl ester carboxylesterase
MSGLGVPSFPPDLVAMFSEVRRAAAERGVDAAREIWRAGGWFAPARERSPQVRADLDAILDDYSGWYWLHQNPSTNLVPPALEQLGSLKMPVLVIDGERDLDYNHAVATELAARIADVRLVRLSGVGHMAPMEDPALVTPELERFADERTFPSRS